MAMDQSALKSCNMVWEIVKMVSSCSRCSELQTQMVTGLLTTQVSIFEFKFCLRY